MSKHKEPKEEVTDLGVLVDVALWYGLLSAAAELSAKLEMQNVELECIAALNSENFTDARIKTCNIINRLDNEINKRFIQGREVFAEKFLKEMYKFTRKQIRY